MATRHGILCWVLTACVGLALTGCAGSRLQGGQRKAAARTASGQVTPAPVVGLSASPTPALPQTLPAANAKAASRPNLFLLPIELESDGGATNGNATLLRLIPTYEWRLRSDWRVQNIDLITIANAPGGIPGSPGNPEPIPGARATGLGDLVHVSLLTPKPKGHLIWGAGAALGLPTATSEVLGSGKWSAGPAFRITYRKGPWNLAGLGAQRWSFAGDSDRAAISQFMLRGAVRRRLGSGWFLVSAPIITANWNAASGERWLVPLGGGIGKHVKLCGVDCAISLQGYANVIKPTGAPDWSVRLGLAFIFPLHD
jgi:hypothetical protein